MGAKLFGASVLRKEDPRFLRGDGRYVDDIKRPGLLHAAFVRSPYAHAVIRSIKLEAARRLRGVAHVFAFADLERWMKPLPLFGAVPPGLAARVAVSMKQVPQLAMGRDRVRFVGEIVAMVLAESRALAEDGCELVEVEYEPLPVVTDMVAGAEPGTPVIHLEWQDNVAVSFQTGFGDADAAVAAADVTVRERLEIQRYVGMPMETRGVVAQWDARDGSLTTWNSTQVVHFVQQGLVAALGLSPHKIRVIAPDVGGGFGTKANGYPEDLLIPVAAIASRRPVKWTEDRREHMMSAAHARHQLHDIEIAARRDGTMLAVRDRIWLDLGAYNSWGIVLPYNTVAHLLGPHRVPNLRVECRGVVTNKTPNAPYRGAGRPETVFAMDRIVDCLARALSMDPAELRRRNYLAESDMPYEIDLPYRDGNRLIYDSGDFKAGLEAALSAIGYESLRAEQRDLRTRGIYGKVRDKIAEAAATLLEAAPADIDITDGTVSVRGAPATAMPLGRVIQAAIPTFAGPGVASPDFEATVYHHQPTVTYTSAVHVAHVEVDPGTGSVRLLRYLVAHDCGKLINPVIVEGQIHGGVAQGVGGALLEEMVYDEQAQLLTGTFMDYLVPTAMELPAIETVHLEYPSPRNPLGIKGIGEGGAISPPAAIANAVEDALAPFGVRVTRTPLGPSVVLGLLEAAPRR